MKIVLEKDQRLTFLARRHLLYGWLCLFFFTAVGVGLESLLAYKVPLYVDADNEARRLLWRLAHAHGTLLALIQMGFSWSLSHLSERPAARQIGGLSWLFLAAGLLVPLGFLGAGIDAVDGDPGPTIALVPAGAVALLIASGWTAWLFVAHTVADRTPRTDDSDARTPLLKERDQP